ncbi:AP-3 complex subunit sigma-like [Macrosteles quadrilineatus]|uniref:AP-3 complex subunit sigma-like n=1 Tax=Macrosteles quadrilineatus TaxID=74068 RepID=UPI0023E0C433|nr:AP-3 complex subunit sigma-like [Macrosteles quadrilineatus]
MINAVLVFNNYGKPRLMKFYTHYPEVKQQQILADIFQAVSQRTSDNCNFIERSCRLGDDLRIMYRHFTTLYFVFCCDASESELAILDLIQVFVEALDKCFKNVCELDLIFHVDRAHHILDEIVMGGVVLETDIDEVITRYENQRQAEYNENRVTPVISMPSIPTIIRDRLPSLQDFKMPDVAYAVRDIGGL